MPDPLSSTRLRTVALLLLPGAAAAYLAFRSGGAAAGLTALVAIGCLGGLLLRAAPGSLDARVAQTASAGALMALPGLLTVYFAFNAGGFFPETPAFVAIVLILVLVVRVTTADDPLGGFGWLLAVAAGALGLLCVWIVLSGGWSDAPARALVEFDRAFAYLLLLVLFGSLPRNADTLRWMVRGLALGITVVVVAAFLTRALPEVFPTEPGLSKRLGWPLTYWNALGILGSLGAILCLHLTASLREHLAVRVMAAAALPAIGATVLLTFSRGAILAGILGLVLYALLGRPRGLATGVLAAVPLGALAVKQTYDATHLSGESQTSPAAIDQGQDLALTLALCCLGAALLRLALGAADVRLRSLTARWQPGRRLRVGAWAGAAAVAVIVLLAIDAPGRLEAQYDRFVDTPTTKAYEETRDRLTDPANTGRIDHWNVAFDLFGEAELRGKGAGTYGPYWMQNRPPENGLVVDDAHSLYVEVLAELGLVGIVLLVVALALLIGSLAPVRRGADRAVYAALFAAASAWAVHAGIDWDWEMPAVTAWLFCLGGAALAARPADVESRSPGPSSGVRVVVGALLLAGAIAPALVFVSQRQIDDAADAYERGDCREATERAADAIRTLENRPEPYEVLALCNVREGLDRQGVAAVERAVQRDPGNWEYLYTLAVVRGSAGIDPRAAAREALRRNPRDVLTQSLARYADTDDRGRWIARLRPIAENERLSVAR